MRVSLTFKRSFDVQKKLNSHHTSVNDGNHCNSNIVDNSGALFTLSLTILTLNSQHEEGAREMSGKFGYIDVGDGC